MSGDSRISIGNVVVVDSNGNVTGNTVTSGNLIPATDNSYFLGNATNRWANIWLGPGTIYITDQANTANTAQLTVSDGILQVNGTTGLQANLVSGNTTLTLANSGNISLSVSGTSNIAVFSDNSVTVAGNISSGNVSASDTTMSLPSYPAQSSPWVMPEIPSVIVTIVPVGP